MFTKRLKRFLIVQCILLALFLAGLVWFYTSGYAGKISEMKSEAERLVRNSSADTFKKSQTSIAYDVTGKTLSVLKGEKDVYYLKSDAIPLNAKNAIISVEDKKFYKHHGVDYKAIVRAAYSMFRNRKITQGASTITQQLARNIFLSQERTWERKLEEIFIASELEKKYSKSAILEFYLNNIYFGNGYYGIQAASIGYFSKEVSELSVAQTAFLLAIPNNPSYYDPLVHFDHTLKRRNWILENMLEERMISENVYDNSIRETIILNLSKDQAQRYDYAETYTFFCASRALMEHNGFVFQTQFASDEAREAYQSEYEEAYSQCYASLFSGGYRIYTSLNLEIQAALQESVDSQLATFTEKSDEGIFALQGAAVCIDNPSGMVRAIVGGRSQNLVGYTLNRAYQSFRQPGSSIKPLIVYTPALERGYTAESIVDDRRIEDGPTNADNYFAGKMSLRRAVEISKNTVAWNIFEELTPEVGLSYLRKMYFSRIVDKDEVPAASIGGLTNGVSPLEMAKGYATIENDGLYREPSCIIRITDAQNNLIYKASQTQTVIYEETAARRMTDILEGVLTKEYATGYGWGLENIEMPAAAKTGTTNDSKDGWFVGYTRYFTTSVWVGYDQPRTMQGLRHSNYPGSIWHKFMLWLHDGLDPKPFPKPFGEETEESEEDEYITVDGELVNIRDIMEDGAEVPDVQLDEEDGGEEPEADESVDTPAEAQEDNTDGAEDVTEPANGAAGAADETDGAAEQQDGNITGGDNTDSEPDIIQGVLQPNRTEENTE